MQINLIMKCQNKPYKNMVFDIKDFNLVPKPLDIVNFLDKNFRILNNPFKYKKIITFADGPFTDLYIDVEFIENEKIN